MKTVLFSVWRVVVNLGFKVTDCRAVTALFHPHHNHLQCRSRWMMCSSSSLQTEQGLQCASPPYGRTMQCVGAHPKPRRRFSSFFHATTGADTWSLGCLMFGHQLSGSDDGVVGDVVPPSSSMQEQDRWMALVMLCDTSPRLA